MQKWNLVSERELHSGRFPKYVASTESPVAEPEKRLCAVTEARNCPHAPGGALDYLVNGKMIGGFGLVAYPAQYRNSGVMTFMVSHEGTVFQKDLGPDTDEIAERIKSFDPDPSWKKVDVTEPAK